MGGSHLVREHAREQGGREATPAAVAAATDHFRTRATRGMVTTRGVATAAAVGAAAAVTAVAAVTAEGVLGHGCAGGAGGAR